jgi:ribosomal protein L3 glutamine methyltransferase
MPARKLTLRALITLGARRLARARVHFGHGTDNAWDEAASLVLHALRLSPARSARAGARPIETHAAEEALALIARRIRERVPAPYLTGRIWFAGLELEIDRRVLIPRSPIAELIERGFAPWIDPARVHRVLDLGTGSGCIALACARVFASARVDATDVSAEALAVARRNVRRLRLGPRVQLLCGSYFEGLGSRSYDIIVSNPPYVGARELAALPPEYGHEPRIALAAGREGLSAVRVILREAARHLRPCGILVVEVGNTEQAVRRAFARVPFTWLEFERGGGGVFVLTREQLQAAIGRHVRK